MDFFPSLVNPTEDVLFPGTIVSLTGPETDFAAFEGFFNPGEGLTNVSSAVQSQFQNIPVGSTVAGFTYEFDPDLNVFVQSSKSLGPGLAERADTNGRFKLNISASYSHIDFRRCALHLGMHRQHLPGSLGSKVGWPNELALRRPRRRSPFPAKHTWQEGRRADSG
jgi:hypothetical protein